MTWLEENNRFKEYIRFKESKESIIRKLSSLTDEQKQIAINFFNQHQSWEREIDWNKGQNLTWDNDFVPVIYKERTTNSQKYKRTKQDLHKAIEGLEEGVDYLALANGIYKDESWILYQPLSYKGSKVLASNYVPPVRTDLNYRGNPLSGAQWCVAWGSTNSYWIKHVVNGKEAFLYLFGESIPTKKVAICVCTTPDKAKDVDSVPFKYSYQLKDSNGELENYGINTWNFEDNRQGYVPLIDDLESILNLKKYAQVALNNYPKIEGYTKSGDVEKDKVVEEYGTEAAEAYEDIFGQIESVESFEDKYIGHFDSFKDFADNYLGDCDLDIDTVCNFLDLRPLGKDIISNELTYSDKEELIERYIDDGIRAFDSDGNEIDLENFDDERNNIDWDDCSIYTEDMDFVSVGSEYVYSTCNKHTSFRTLLEEEIFNSNLDWDFIEDWSSRFVCISAEHYFCDN